MEYVVGAIIGLLAGVGVGYVLNRLVLGTAYKTREGILQEAGREADNLRQLRRPHRLRPMRRMPGPADCAEATARAAAAAPRPPTRLRG